jgi:phage I-like protein
MIRKKPCIYRTNHGFCQEQIARKAQNIVVLPRGAPTGMDGAPTDVPERAIGIVIVHRQRTCAKAKENAAHRRIFS